jgi:hypothetical protein
LEFFRWKRKSITPILESPGSVSGNRQRPLYHTAGERLKKVEKVLDVRPTAGVPYQRWITKGYAKHDLYLLLHLLLRAIGAQASSL